MEVGKERCLVLAPANTRGKTSDWNSGSTARGVGGRLRLLPRAGSFLPGTSSAGPCRGPLAVPAAPWCPFSPESRTGTWPHSPPSRPGRSSRHPPSPHGARPSPPAPRVRGARAPPGGRAEPSGAAERSRAEPRAALALCGRAPRHTDRAAGRAERRVPRRARRPPAACRAGRCGPRPGAGRRMISSGWWRPSRKCANGERAAPRRDPAPASPRAPRAPRRPRAGPGLAGGRGGRGAGGTQQPFRSGESHEGGGGVWGREAAPLCGRAPSPPPPAAPRGPRPAALHRRSRAGRLGHGRAAGSGRAPPAASPYKGPQERARGGSAARSSGWK